MGDITELPPPPSPLDDVAATFNDFGEEVLDTSIVGIVICYVTDEGGTGYMHSGPPDAALKMVAAAQVHLALQFAPEIEDDDS